MTLVQNLGTRAYGSNPTFTLTFQQTTLGSSNWTNTDPTAGAYVNLTDEAGTPYTALLNHSGAGVYTFQVPGGLMTAGTWTGRGYAPSGTGQASVDFTFWVEPSANP